MPATIRKLLGSDRNDILEISRHIWKGHDYLSSVVDEWLQDPNCNFYGVEADGRVVAVGSLRIVENGQTGWMEGLRVHPEYRGKGFANEITRYLVRKAECLNVQRLRYATSDRNAASLKLARMAGFKRVLKMAVFWHLSPKPIPQTEDYPLIEKASAAEAYRLLKKNPSIIPHGIVEYDWKALDSTLQNLKEISKTHELYIALKNGKVDSFSLGCSRWEPDESWLSFTTYAIEWNGFLCQLSHNIALASKRGLKSITCTYETRFEKALNEMDLGRPEDRWRTRMVLFEKQIQA